MSNSTARETTSQKPRPLQRGQRHFRALGYVRRRCSNSMVAGPSEGTTASFSRSSAAGSSTSNTRRNDTRRRHPSKHVGQAISGPVEAVQVRGHRDDGATLSNDPGSPARHPINRGVTAPVARDAVSIAPRRTPARTIADSDADVVGPGRHGSGTPTVPPPAGPKSFPAQPPATLKRSLIVVCISA